MMTAPAYASLAEELKVEWRIKLFNTQYEKAYDKAIARLGSR